MTDTYVTQKLETIERKVKALLAERDALATENKQLKSLLGRIHKATDQFYTKQKEDKKPDPVPYQEIVDLYHKVLPDLPKVVKLTDKRKRAIRNRWHRDLETRTDWALYFKDASRKPFLFGRNGRGWVADFDFFLREQTIAFMQEGKYDG